VTTRTRLVARLLGPLCSSDDSTSLPNDILAHDRYTGWGVYATVLQAALCRSAYAFPARPPEMNLHHLCRALGPEDRAFDRLFSTLLLDVVACELHETVCAAPTCSVSTGDVL
jgi:hypothetical protein